MMKINTKLRAVNDIPHGALCNDPHCEAEASEICAGEEAMVIDVYRNGFYVEMAENENVWFFRNGQAHLWEVI